MEVLLAGLVVVAGVVCCGCGLLSLRKTVLDYKGNASFGISLFLFLFLYALWGAYARWQEVRTPWAEQMHTYKVILKDTPRLSARTVGAEGWLMPCGHGRDGQVISLSFQKDTLSSRLQVGDEVVFRGVIRLPENHGNPEEFDYAGYLAVRGMSGRVYIPAGDWQKLRSFDDADHNLPLVLSVRIKALLLREKMLQAYRSAGLGGEELALFSALTLGERSGLSKELKDIYADLGVSHVLALSGMHLTYLVALLNFMLLRFCRNRFFGCIGGMVALTMVWGYTFLAGLPPSLVRATVMYTLMLVGSLMGRTGFSLNSLAVSAILMLCIEPLLLYDVSFQLSFLAMVGILMVYPYCRGWFPASCPYVGWLGKSLWLSFAAQTFTVPLVIYRFGMFAVYSALATLVISPVAALLVYCMPVLLLVSTLGLPAGFCAKIVAGLVALQNGCLRQMMEWPCAVIDVGWPLWLTALCYVLLLVLLSRPWMSHVRWLECSLVGLLVLICAGFVNWRQKQNCSGWVFYYLPKCPAVHVVYAPDCSYLFPVYADSVRGQMTYIAETFWRKRLSRPPVVVMDGFADGRVVASGGLVRCSGRFSMLMLSDNRWNRLRGDSPVEVDYMYVCRGFSGTLSGLAELFHPRCVVLDASLSSGARARYAAECRELAWDFHDIRKEGALTSGLDE